MTSHPSELDVLHAEHHALSVAMHARPPANPVRASATPTICGPQTAILPKPKPPPSEPHDAASPTPQTPTDRRSTTMNTETDQAAARVSEAQVHQIADALWDDMIGASRSTVRNVLRDLFVAAGIEVAS